MRALGKPGTWPIAVAALIALTGACSAPEAAIEGVDQSLLEGLPRDVVDERLSDPVFLENLSGFDASERTQVVQLQVASTVFCRDLLQQYQGWILTGMTAETPAVVRPTTPQPGFDPFMDSWITQAQDAIDEGDPESLRRHLLMSGGCREVIVDAGADQQETIADVLQG